MKKSPLPIYMFMRATVTTIHVKFSLCVWDIFSGRCVCNNYISPKNDKPLQEARTLVVDMCTGQMRQPKIPHSTLYY